jgi:acyl-CoA thioesterase YciA
MNAAESRIPEIRMVMMPRDTNWMGSIFGGHILSLIDQAAGQHARGIARRKFVTKIMREVNFIAPVYVGDCVSFYCDTVKVGTSSVTIRCDVEALRGIDTPETISVTSAEIVMVSVDDKGKPMPIKALS